MEKWGCKDSLHIILVYGGNIIVRDKQTPDFDYDKVGQQWEKLGKTQKGKRKFENEQVTKKI